MSGDVSFTYAAAVSTPNGDMRQPQIQARACSDPDMQSSYESQSRDEIKAKPRRPGAGIRAKTSFRGWTKKGKEAVQNPRGAVQEVQYSRDDQSPRSSREEHRPRTGIKEEYVYVLTLKLDETLSQPMNRMREQYFPKTRTPAHLTLFHALPHSQLEAIHIHLAEVARNTRAFQVTTGGPFRMRRGVGVGVDAGYQKMRDMHAILQLQWLPFLSEQDAGGFRPHWTVMNKVDNEKEVDQVFRKVRSELATNTHEGHAIGFDLWKYEQGGWAWTSEYVFDSTFELLTSPRVPRSQNDSAGHSIRKDCFAGSQRSDTSGQRPGLKRGSSVAEAWRSMSFRHRS